MYCKNIYGGGFGGVLYPVHRYYNELFTVHEINKQNILIHEENKKNFGAVGLLLVKMREAYSRPGYAKF